MVAGFLLGPSLGLRADSPFDNLGTNVFLNSWSFVDSTNWTSDNGSAPISFTNLEYSYLGNGYSLMVNSTNAAWLQFNVVETNGATNLTVDAGTVMFWFAPSWSSASAGGTGPGEYGRLIEAGAYTPDSSFGWWSLYVDDVGKNIYFSAQTNDLSSNIATYLSAPISWTTNYFHHVALTYCATNTALYLDGSFVTNGPPLTVYPGADVLASGFYIGSDSNGVLQADGLFNSVATYSGPLDAGTIQQIFNEQYTYYIVSPWNVAMSSMASAPSIPSPLPNVYDIITGNLNPVGTITAITSTNVWITNVTTHASSGGMSMTFAIQGGNDGVPYDVFINPVLAFGTNGAPWSWMGQGYHGNLYTLTNLPNTACFLILGAPRDGDFDGLTDAFELLVSKTNPNKADSDGDGIADSDEILFGSNPLVANGGWKLDTDQDGLPDTYETQVGLNPNSAESAPLLPTFSLNPVP